MRVSLSSLMVAAGLDPSDPQSMTRQWGLNRQLSWKVVKVIQHRDAYVSLQHLPGNEGLSLILRRAEQAGVSASLLDGVREAACAFDALIETHCGDRAVFDIMGSGLSHVDQALQQQENQRKQFFLGASSIWGAQAKVNFASWYVGPSAGECAISGQADLVNIKAWIGFRRLRENLSWAMSRQMSRHDSGASMAIDAPEPLDAGSSSEVPLLRQFCTDPVPDFSLREEGGRTTVSLDPGPVGNAGQISCVFGKIFRRMPHVRSGVDRLSRFMSYLNVPSELAIMDLFVHRSMAKLLPPSVTLSSLIDANEPDPERSRLPLNDPLIDLGVPTPAPFTLEVPRYAEMFDLVMTRMQWSAEDFLGYRMRINYPPLPAALVMRYELPGAS